MKERLNFLEQLIRSYQFNFTNEAELQTAIESILTENNINFIREYSLSEKSRIDFLIGDIGLEIKVGFSYAEVIRQLHQYAQFDEITTLILFTSRLSHTMPKELNGKILCTINISLTNSL